MTTSRLAADWADLPGRGTYAFVEDFNQFIELEADALQQSENILALFVFRVGAIGELVRPLDEIHFDLVEEQRIERSDQESLFHAHELVSRIGVRLLASIGGRPTILLVVLVVQLSLKAAICAHSLLIGERRRRRPQCGRIGCWLPVMIMFPLEMGGKNFVEHRHETL